MLDCGRLPLAQGSRRQLDRDLRRGKRCLGQVVVEIDDSAGGDGGGSADEGGGGGDANDAQELVPGAVESWGQRLMPRVVQFPVPFSAGQCHQSCSAS